MNFNFKTDSLKVSGLERIILEMDKRMTILEEKIKELEEKVQKTEDKNYFTNKTHHS